MLYVTSMKLKYGIKVILLCTYAYLSVTTHIRYNTTAVLLHQSIVILQTSYISLTVPLRFNIITQFYCVSAYSNDFLNEL